MCAVPNAVAFRSYLISWFPGILLRYCLTDFEMVPVDTGIPFAFTSTRAEFVIQGLYILDYYYYYYYYYWLW
jgi:hypothetical protein